MDKPEWSDYLNNSSILLQIASHRVFSLSHYFLRVTVPSSCSNKGWLIRTRQVSESSKTSLLWTKSPLGFLSLSWWEQYGLLSLRGIKERRHDYFSWLRVTQVLSTAIILGLLWWQSDIHHPKGLQDQVGLLFFTVFWGFFPVFTAIFTFPHVRAMLSKERESNMYRLSAYFVARTTSDLLLDLILPVLFLVVVYFMAGLRLSAESFFLSVLTVFLCIVAAQLGLGLEIGASLMDLKKATTLASVRVMTFMLAGGYFVKRVKFQIAWICFMSFNYHTYKLLVKVQYQEIMENVNGEEIESGIKEVSALVAMVIGYRLLAYLSLRRMKLHSST
ncbi:PREDICTED: ABC transporter G family member 27-like [Camelina sativa]|uniref:ABC transporter G family member 27-like n=1 Tax=Camelina sativa TaxID=90675 RepID=A0ABM1QFN5_CAMSA|nr:PREDICTED: ABC transporter G family member 27-like [Camelina sativa]